MDAYSSGSTGDVQTTVVVRRTRSKRRRGLGPPQVAASDSSSASGVESGVTDEEEDMANCLILLAQGRGKGEKFTNRRLSEGETGTVGRAGFCVYECKTCNKCFPSFQALGGHRASHKKHEMVASSAEGKKGIVEESGLQIRMNSLSSPTVLAGGRAKVHMCSMCGSEFSSGQALGGHMRRHRSPAATAEIGTAGEKKERSVLSLDLNLPAPSDDNGGQFSIAVVSAVYPPAVAASALVDCHY